jgi:hypothetical protein
LKQLIIDSKKGVEHKTRLSKLKTIGVTMKNSIIKKYRNFKFPYFIGYLKIFGAKIIEINIKPYK